MGVVVRCREVKNFTVLRLTETFSRATVLAHDFQECFLVIPPLGEEEARKGWSGEKAHVPAGIRL